MRLSLKYLSNGEPDYDAIYSSRPPQTAEAAQVELKHVTYLIRTLNRTDELDRWRWLKERASGSRFSREKALLECMK